jgi:hypothetical protein
MDAALSSSQSTVELALGYNVDAALEPRGRDA